jgi:hypothetical protein
MRGMLIKQPGCSAEDPSSVQVHRTPSLPFRGTGTRRKPTMPFAAAAREGHRSAWMPRSCSCVASEWIIPFVVRRQPSLSLGIPGHFTVVQVTVVQALYVRHQFGIGIDLFISSPAHRRLLRHRPRWKVISIYAALGVDHPAQLRLRVRDALGASLRIAGLPRLPCRGGRFGLRHRVLPPVLSSGQKS